MSSIRLNKILSQAGVASRRLADELLTQGRVEVNGRVVTEPGARADPDVDGGGGAGHERRDADG